MTAKTCVLPLVLLSLSGASFAQSDVEGSEDHPIISRYPDSIIE
jgi:hypothetical protein